MEKLKKEEVLQELKDYINMLVEFDRFKLATMYCNIAAKIFYGNQIEKVFLYQGTPNNIDIKIKEYLEQNNLLQY